MVVIVVGKIEGETTACKAQSDLNTRKKRSQTVLFSVEESDRMYITWEVTAKKKKTHDHHSLHPDFLDKITTATEEENFSWLH